MKNVSRKLFVLLITVLCVFAFAGCGNKSELEEANKKISELESQLKQKEEAIANAEEKAQQIQKTLKEANEKVETLKAEVSNLKEELEKATSGEVLEELNQKISDLQKELDANISFIATGLRLDEELLGEVFGGTSQDGVYTVKTGQEFMLPVLFGENLLGSEELAFDYIWDTTADYNGGIEFGEDGKFTTKLKGVYYVSAVYAKLVTDEEGNVDASGTAYGVATGAVPGVLVVLNVVNDLEVGLGEDFTATVELGAAMTGQVFVSEGFTVQSYQSSDVAVATVSETGLVTAVAPGKATISVVVKNNNNEEDVRTRYISVTVLEKREASELAGGAEGMNINLKYAPLETQTKILAYLERTLINAGASIPVLNDSGLVIYTERVNFIADEYVANMGYGPTAVAPSTGKGAGTKEDPAYRMYTSADPSTLNHLNYADSVESDFLTLLLGQLIAFDWKLDENGKGVGFEIKPEMLSVLPYAVDAENQKVEGFNGLDAYTTWKFDLRKDLKWENGDALNANDFMYTFKLVLDPKLNMKRANYFYAGSAPIKGAKEYFTGATSDWESVGIKKVDDYSFTITFAQALKEWDVCYNYSGFLMTPVHQATWEANLGPDGTPRYGSSKESFMASGLYKLSYWEKGKEYRFAKNENYFVWNEKAENVEVLKPGYENMSYTIVKDANAALELFKAGLLDVTSVPASAYDDFKDWPNQKFVPGSTSFRLTTNRLTQAELDDQFGVGAWEAKPIMQEDDFMWALFFATDRKGVQQISKTLTGWDSYFTNAYSIVTPTKEGVDSVTYRESEWGKKVYTGIDELDYDLLHEDLGYAPALAEQYYIDALRSMVEKGVFNPSEKYEVCIEVATFDGATYEAMFTYVVDNYNKIFNSEKVKEAFPNVTFRCEYAPQPGMDVYYAKQMAGRFDLALAGISGGTLEPAGFMECFCDDNRSGLFLSVGFDSHSANILIDLDLDGDGELDGAKYWSFAALYSALMGDVFVQNGVEAEAPSAE